jgi:hypothetical protein
MHARRRRRKVSGAQSEIGDMSAMMCVLSACIYMQMAARSPMRYLNEFAMRLGLKFKYIGRSRGPFLATGNLFPLMLLGALFLLVSGTEKRATQLWDASRFLSCWE